jgi:hypothetical protein
MSLLCSTTCGTIASPPASYFDCTDEFREYGANLFALVKCDYQFTDITDATEWNTAITSGDVQISPPGQVLMQAPTQTVTEIEGCRREVVGDIQYTIDFNTLQVAPDLSDYTYWKTLFANAAAYRIIIIHCDGRFMMEDEFIDQANGGTPVITGKNPGFEFSVTAVPYIGEQTDLRYEQWITQFRIKRSQATGVIAAAALPDVYAAIKPS